MRCEAVVRACISASWLCWEPARGCVNSMNGAIWEIETSIYVVSSWSNFIRVRALTSMLLMRFGSTAGTIERIRAAAAA